MRTIADGLFARRPAVGLAYSNYVLPLLESQPDAIDFVETPFELLIQNPVHRRVQPYKPVVMHCASLSMASPEAPPHDVVQRLREFVEETATPWVGEHLAFVSVERPTATGLVDEVYPNEPFNIGYAVNPPANEETIDTVVASVSRYADRFSVPLLLENSPVYFEPPGSTMTQPAMLAEICRRCDVNLLLDLTHLYITARTTETDPFALLNGLPLDRVVEVHVSGTAEEDGIPWDDHTAAAPKLVLDLLREVHRSTQLVAVTLEYNWSSEFPRDLLARELESVHTSLAG